MLKGQRADVAKKRFVVRQAGGPLKPVFGLSGAVRLLDKVFPLLVRDGWPRFAPVLWALTWDKKISL
jgi:hypothetical protein